MDIEKRKNAKGKVTYAKKKNKNKELILSSPVYWQGRTVLPESPSRLDKTFDIHPFSFF